MKLMHYILLIFSLLSTPSFAGEILLARDLVKDARQANQKNLPIVFFVTSEHCPFCERLRDEYFKFSPNDKRFILRELVIDEAHNTANFNGKIISHYQLAKRYNISLTPTIAFVDAKGEMLAEPIIGLVGMDYYHYYFEKALRASISTLKKQQIAKLD